MEPNDQFTMMAKSKALQDEKEFKATVLKSLDIINAALTAFTARFDALEAKKSAPEVLSLKFEADTSELDKARSKLSKKHEQAE
jgi:hypothetical protein